MARYLTRESEPYGKWKGIPIYLTTIITAAFVIGLFVSAILFSARSPLLFTLTFALPSDSWSELAAAFTYPFIDEVTFFTPFSILFFYWLAVGIETHLGRAVLARLLVLLTLVPVVAAAILWFVFGVPTAALGAARFGLSGNFLLSASLIIAFATLYPNTEMGGWIPFKWVAFACFVCGSLMQISSRYWVGLIALWAGCLAAFLYIRHAVEMEHDDYVPLAVRLRGFFRRKPKLRVVRRPEHVKYRDRQHAPNERSAADIEAEMDGLLDKIAKSGLDSLTGAERKRLEKAREALLKKERQ